MKLQYQSTVFIRIVRSFWPTVIDSWLRTEGVKRARRSNEKMNKANPFGDIKGLERLSGDLASGREI